MKNVEIEKLANGALQENAQRAIENVIANCQDPNTPWKPSREVTIKLKFTQNEYRDDCRCEISVATKLAPVKPLETKFAIGQDLKTGELYAEEYGKQIRGQMSVEDMIEKVEIDGKTVDTETGEIIETENNVIDMRSQRKA